MVYFPSILLSLSLLLDNKKEGTSNTHVGHGDYVRRNAMCDCSVVSILGVQQTSRKKVHLCLFIGRGNDIIRSMACVVCAARHQRNGLCPVLVGRGDDVGRNAVRGCSGSSFRSIQQKNRPCKRDFTSFLRAVGMVYGGLYCATVTLTGADTSIPATPAQPKSHLHVAKLRTKAKDTFTQ